MLVEEIITDGYRQIWGRGSKGAVRRYRCTSGSKKGRVVAKPSTCSTAVNQKRSYNLKKTRRAKSGAQSIKRGMTMKRSMSKKISKMNRSIRPRKRKF